MKVKCSKLQTESADQFKFYQIQDILKWEISEKAKVMFSEFITCYFDIWSRNFSLH
jgi:hypothetical protein